MVAIKQNSGEGSSLYGSNEDALNTGSAVVGWNNGTTSAEYVAGGYFSGVNYGVTGIARAGGSTSYGLFTSDDLHVGGTTSAFTASHIAFSSSWHNVGDIVVVERGRGISINKSFVIIKQSTIEMDKRVFGVVERCANDIDTFGISKELIGEVVNDRKSVVSSVDRVELLADNMKRVVCNAIGEGMINVCDANGDIEIGDYICSSNVAGKGMKQNDDLLHNYTVAKALENVAWTGVSGSIKMIACTYHCA